MLLKKIIKITYHAKTQTFITYLCPPKESHIDGIYNV